MLITKRSMLSGIAHTRDIAISPAQLEAWQTGTSIQRVAPWLSADDREFLISGSTSEEWDKALAEEEATC